MILKVFGVFLIFVLCLVFFINLLSDWLGMSCMLLSRERKNLSESAYVMDHSEVDHCYYCALLSLFLHFVK